MGDSKANDRHRIRSGFSEMIVLAGLVCLAPGGICLCSASSDKGLNDDDRSIVAATG